MNDKYSNELNYLTLSSLGDVVPLKLFFDEAALLQQLSEFTDQWKPYNSNKQGFGREGLSLFSLDGSTAGDIDLNSVRQYNRLNGTDYDEMSFNKKTPHWDGLNSMTGILRPIEGHLGRSHLIRLRQGGFFPPHRDYGNSFRLIAFFNCTHSNMNFLVDDKKIFFNPNQLYFVNTRKKHSLFNFGDDAFTLVLNAELSPHMIKFVIELLQDQ